jgi:anaphase-promoting complex subunit 8
MSHKFKWETCCILGLLFAALSNHIILANYYSRRKLHDCAIDFLKRAIRMRPDDAQIWILLGHEYLQTKNQQGAILAYRRATCNFFFYIFISHFISAVDSRSYRAWYGLGQLYEILKLPAYALYYYQQAVRCKPTDSRMLVATGVVLGRLKRYEDAERCFKKAFQIGDIEGTALTHLARLVEERKATQADQNHID